MKPEDKQLLIRDLCSRLPYKVIVSIAKGTPNGIIWEDMPLSTYFLEFEDVDCGLEYIKPYLRPMSSMTNDERDKFFSFVNGSDYLCLGKKNEDEVIVWKDTPVLAADWLNVHHFDYRNLIVKGLAIEAPEGMYNKEDKKWKR